MEAILLLSVFAPLAASIFAGLFARRKKHVFIGIANSLLIGVSFVSSLALLFQVQENGAFALKLYSWLSAGNFSLSLGLVADELSTVMIAVVATVSFVVHIYSIGYMAHDAAFNRFFSYLGAFVFSMMILVASDNFLGLFIGWEGVGLCSYLLIGFWYHKESASFAANEAFIMNRVADLGMLIGIFLIYWNVGSLDYKVFFSSLNALDALTLNLIAAFLFIGAMGKSAQFPFHTWLADAMEGPTPVSALIHAATMVTAGVYLVVRAHDLYTLTPEISFFIASLGAFVALFAASMAVVNTDLKRVIAYSTLSQLGYMFVAAGLGAYWVALFHLMTHAFFKALLFLGAGNVMHAMSDELNIKKMGGLYKVLKPTAVMMTIGSVALAGVYPFAGFFSKDKILEAAFGYGHFGIWLVLLAGAMMTAFYSFRVVMLVFFTNERYKNFGFHPHEMPRFVLVAMSVLAVLAIVAGFFEPFYKDYVARILPIDMPHTGDEMLLVSLTLALVLLSIAFAVYKYARGGFSPAWESNILYKILSANYYIPKIYAYVFIGSYKKIAYFLWIFADKKIIDFSVDLVARLVFFGSKILRAHHSGNISSMLRLMGLGLFALVFAGLILVKWYEG
ncbi:MAG: NADH-quinone oxidoreductase subunit L [Helicobacteraceae bacterium]